MPEFDFTEVLLLDANPGGPHDTTYRLVTTEGVSTFETPEGRFLKVEPEALTRLTQEAMRDIAHLLRPTHLQQLRNILDDPEASANDRFGSFCSAICRANPAKSVPWREKWSGGIRGLCITP